MPKYTRLLAILLLNWVAFAQDRGSIRGTVTDESGAPAPEAQVTTRNVNTGLTQSAKTGTDGVYNLLYLPAGEYSLTVEKTGFRKTETSGIKVNVATVTDLDVKLTIGAVEQSVEVTASAQLLEVQGNETHPIDSAGAANAGDRLIVSELTLRKGRVVWDLNGRASENWKAFRYEKKAWKK